MAQLPLAARGYGIWGHLQDPNGPTTVNPNSRDRNPPQYDGIQAMHKFQDPYGPMRAYLHPIHPGGKRSHGNYLHGQARHRGGRTHGCLTYGQDDIRYIWDLAERVGVAVGVPVYLPQ
jgi:hypothetical protein